VADIPRVGRDQYQVAFDKNIAPVLSVPSGSTVIIEAEDSHFGIVRNDDVAFDDVATLFTKFGGLNPVTGPIYVEGASPGDCLAVEIRSMVVAPEWGRAYSARTPEGALESPYSIGPRLSPKTTLYEIEDDAVVFPTEHGPIRLPLQPMVGTIGVAPMLERRTSFQIGADFLGNVDIPDIGPGATVVLPVHHKGALFSLGDCHATQGDGEISSGGIEIQADIEVTLTAMSREEARFIDLPQVNTEEWIGSAACLGGVTLADSVRAAYVDLVRRLERYYGFAMVDAYELLGHAGIVRVGTLIDPNHTALAKIERKYIE
jgi:acetamidase/formamidase